MCFQKYSTADDTGMLIYGFFVCIFGCCWEEINLKKRSGNWLKQPAVIVPFSTLTSTAGGGPFENCQSPLILQNNPALDSNPVCMQLASCMVLWNAINWCLVSQLLAGVTAQAHMHALSTDHIAGLSLNSLRRQTDRGDRSDLTNFGFLSADTA